MEQLRVEQMEPGAVYRLDLEEFRRSKFLGEAGYDGNLERYFTSPFVRVAGSGPHRNLHFIGNYISSVGFPRRAEFLMELVKDVPLGVRFADTIKFVKSTGCDPEIFVVDGRNRMIPAFEFLPNKNKAVTHGAALSYYTGISPWAYQCGKTYWDGFQAEFTTPSGTACHGYLFDQIRAGLVAIHKQATAFNPKAKLTLKNVFRVPDFALQTLAPEYVALGCDPSHNAYGVEPFMPEDARTLPYRMAGGHIHLGFNPDYRQFFPNMVKAMDFFLALPLVGMFAEIDDPLRRQFYGKAGEYRTPAHGLEYRVLSNAWLGDPRVGHAVFDLARAASAPREELPYKDFGTSAEEVQEIINNCNVKAARKLVEKNQSAWEFLMRANINWARELSFDKFWKMVHGGVEAEFPAYRDIYKNWLLDGEWRLHTNDSQQTWRRYVTYGR